MFNRKILLCALLICLSEVLGENRTRSFPQGFKFGAATAAYQVEGAWNEDGKSESIWDYLTHTNPDAILDKSSGDIACDSYHLYERDVEMMEELNLDFYRFSISWTRILPNGFANEINQAGIDYYNRLIDEILSKGIEPVATIYHWDLPQKLQQLGGFANPLISQWFEDYARVLFEYFGDRVKHWVTLNEPKQICLFGYATAQLAPLYSMAGEAEYVCVKHLLLSHATIYHLYDQEFRGHQNGEIGITMQGTWFEPATDSADDVQASLDAMEFEWHQYAHPIFSEAGDFPSEMKRRILENSLAEGYSKSRLPELSQEEIQFIKGTSDFFGVNTYSSRMVYRNASIQADTFAVPSYANDVHVLYYNDPSWPQSDSGSVDVSWGFYKLLKAIRDHYNNPPVYVIENGWSTRGGLNDDDRVNFFKHYLSALLDAVEEGCDVQRYTAWSMMDNFEWLEGYTQSYGLYEVDFNDPNRTRTPRKSAHFYSQVAKTKTLDLDFEMEDIVTK